jgi:hypothetical protein
VRLQLRDRGCDEQNAAQEADAGGIPGREQLAPGARYSSYRVRTEHLTKQSTSYSSGCIDDSSDRIDYSFGRIGYSSQPCGGIDPTRPSD